MSDAKNIVFLDVDGVLNCCATKQLTPSGFIGVMPSRVKLLKEIVEENDAIIVLTSTWKEGWIETPDSIFLNKEARYLVEQLAEFDLEISDITQDRWYDRGRGIVDYLNRHPYKNIVILDDELFSDFWEHGLLPYVVHTSFGVNGGIKPKHVKMARRIFEGKRYTAASLRDRVYPV